MTPPPADPVPLPASLVCALNEDALDDVRTYGDSRERAGLARGVAEERARVVALGNDPQMVALVAEAGLAPFIAAITRGDHERTPDA